MTAQKEMTMDEDQLKGDAAKATGKVESAAGQALGNGETQAKGDARQVQGQAQAAVGTAREAISKAADTAHEAIVKKTDHVGQAVDRASGALQDVKGRVDPLLEEQPYAALGIAAGLGLVVGMLLAGRSPKTIYVRPRS